MTFFLSEFAFPIVLGIAGVALLPLLLSLSFSVASFVVQGILASKQRFRRGEQSGEIYIQNAEEGAGLNEVYGGAEAVAVPVVTWQEVTNVTIQADNSIQKTGGVDFENDAGATLSTVIPDGKDFSVGWALSATPEGRTYCGLMPTSSTVLETDDCPFGLLVSSSTHLGEPAHSIFVFELGVQKHVHNVLYVSGDSVAITRDAGVTKYFHKGVLIYTSTATHTGDLKFSALIATSNGIVSGASVGVGFSTLQAGGGIKTAGTVAWAKQPRKISSQDGDVTDGGGDGGKGGLGRPRVDNITYYTDLYVVLGRGRLRLKKVFFNAELILNLDGTTTGALGDGDGTEYETPPDPNGAPPSGFIGNLAREVWGQLTARERNGAILRWYDGTYEHLADPLIQADVGAENAPAYRGRAGLVIENMNISKYGGIPTVLVIAENQDIQTLEELAHDLCERVGIEPQDRDFSDLVDQRVRGLIVNQPQSPRQTLEYAGLPYNATWHETIDGQLVGTYLGTEPVVTIPEEYWGFVDGDSTTLQDGQPQRRLEFTLDDPTQIPRQVSITAYDPLKNHATTTQHAYRMTGASEGVDSLNLPMTLTPGETRAAAERLLYRRHIEKEHGAVTLPWLYGYLNPNDVFQVNSAGIAHKLRIEQITGALPGPLDVAAVADEVLVFEAVEEAEPGGTVCEDATWECPTNWTVDGGTVENTGGLERSGTALYDAYVQTTATISASGDSFTWTMGTTDAEAYIGVNDSDCPEPFVHGTGFDYWFRGQATQYAAFAYSIGENRWEVWQDDQAEGDGAINGTYTTDTVFAIRIAGPELELLVDGDVVFTTDLSAPEHDLVLPASVRLIALGGAASGTSNPPLRWECVTNFSVQLDPSGLTKNGGLDGYYVAFAQSRQAMDTTGQAFKWTMSNPEAEITVGVGELDCPACTPHVSGYCYWGFGILPWRFYYGLDIAEVLIEDTGGTVAGPFSFDDTTVFEIRRTGSGLDFVIDGVVEHSFTSGIPASLKLGALAGTARFSDSAEPAIFNAEFLTPGVGAIVVGAQTCATSETISGSGLGISEELAEAFVLFADTRQLREADSTPGMYAAVVTRNSSFAGASLYRDRGAGYALVETFSNVGTGGTLVDSVAPEPVDDWDDTTTLTVDLYGTAALFSSTDEDVLNGANAAIIGNGAEVIGFVNATQISTTPNRWELTRLRRGQKCTTYDQTHNAGEQFFLLNSAVKFLPLTLSELNQARFWKAVASGQALAEAPFRSFAWTGRIIEVAAPTAYGLALDPVRREVTHTWTASAAICTLTPGLTYEIYLDDGADNPGVLLWSGATLNWREPVNPEGPRKYHLRAKTDYATSDYIVAEITVDYSDEDYLLDDLTGDYLTEESDSSLIIEDA